MQHVAASCNTEICCATSCLRGGNTGNKALQQCCAASCTKMLPVLLGLKVESKTNKEVQLNLARNRELYQEMQGMS